MVKNKKILSVFFYGYRPSDLGLYGNIYKAEKVASICEEYGCPVSLQFWKKEG